MKERPKGPADASPAVKGSRAVDYALEGVHTATIYDGEQLSPGMAFTRSCSSRTLPIDLDIFSASTVRKPLCIQ